MIPDGNNIVYEVLDLYYLEEFGCRCLFSDLMDLIGEVEGRIVELVEDDGTS
jgi:hypothetical protein